MAVIPRTTFAKKTFNYSATYTPVPIDFSPFRGAIRAAITNSEKEGIVKPISPTSTSKDCAMPQSSIMFSYTNNYTFDLALLQHESLSKLIILSSFHVYILPIYFTKFIKRPIVIEICVIYCSID